MTRLPLGRKLLLLITLTLMIALPLWWGGQPALERLTVIRPHSLVLLACIIPLRWFCLGERYHVMLAHCGQRLTRRRITAIVLASDFLGENTPAASGGMASSLYFFKQAGVTITTSLAIGTLLLMLDGIAIVAILSGCLIGLARIPVLPVIAAGIALITLFVVICWLLLKQPRRLVSICQHRLLRRLLPQPLVQLLHDNTTQLAAQLHRVDRLPLGRLGYVALLTGINWMLRLSLLFVALGAVGASPTWASTALVQATGALAGLFTLLPGGFPAADISIAALLQLTQPIMVIAPALIVWRLITYYLSVVSGGGCLVWLTMHQTPRASIQSATTYDQQN